MIKDKLQRLVDRLSRRIIEVEHNQDEYSEGITAAYIVVIDEISDIIQHSHEDKTK